MISRKKKKFSPFEFKGGDSKTTTKKTVFEKIYTMI